MAFPLVSFLFCEVDMSAITKFFLIFVKFFFPFCNHVNHATVNINYTFKLEKYT